MTPHKFDILDCTLRDGSYVNHFRISKETTSQIASALDKAGFKYIETGHGMGLGASRKAGYKAIETDEAYLKATAKAVKKAKWGMFCIPGIAKLDDIDLAAKYKMDFIRIGTNVEEYARSKPFIERAKKHGMFVCSNFMKSYVSKPAEFRKYALEVERYGSDLVYIVDSAGGMFPGDIERYIDAIREKSKTICIGFHGHNNLGLAVANSLMAFKKGASIVDSSLQGFGRSAGNTGTEQFLCALLRLGIDMNIDPVEAMEIGEKLVLPLIKARGLNSVDITSGLAQFHSSYLHRIEKYAVKYHVDPRRLIIAVCKKDKINAPVKLVETEAKKLAKRGVKGGWKPLYKHYYGGEQET